MDRKNENETFKMTYSAQQQEEIQSIRQKYMPKEENKMEQLRALDARASKRAAMISIALGTIGAIIMGTGMSMIMSDFGMLFGAAALPVGIVVGVVGMIMLVMAYPIYNCTLKKEQEKIAPEILRLTEELMK